MRDIWFTLAQPALRKSGVEIGNRLGLVSAVVPWERAVRALMTGRSYQAKSLDAPHWFAGGMRPEAVEAGYIAAVTREMLVLDCDNGAIPSEQMSSMLGGLAHVIVPSNSWEAGFERYHLVIPLDRAVPLDGSAGPPVEVWHSFVEVVVKPWVDSVFHAYGGSRGFDNFKNGVRRYFCYNAGVQARGGVARYVTGEPFPAPWEDAWTATRMGQRRTGVPLRPLLAVAEGYDVGSVLQSLLRASEGLRIRVAILSALCRDVVQADPAIHTRPGVGGPVFYRLPCPHCKVNSVWIPTAVEHRVPLARCNHQDTCGYVADVDKYLLKVVTDVDGGEALKRTFDKAKAYLRRGGVG